MNTSKLILPSYTSDHTELSYFDIIPVSNGYYALAHIDDVHRLKYKLEILMGDNAFFSKPDTMYPDFLAEHKKLVFDYCNDIQQMTLEQQSQAIKFDNKLFVKDDLVLLGLKKHLAVFSTTQKQIIKRFDNIVENFINLIAKTADNKYAFVCDLYEDKTLEIDICAGQIVNRFNFEDVGLIVLTPNNELVITASNKNENFHKRSMESKGILATLKTSQKGVMSMACSTDGRLLFAGYEGGQLDIVEIASFQTIMTTKILDSRILSLVCTKNYHSCIVSDYRGNTKHITWIQNASKEEQFKIGQPTKICNSALGDGTAQLKQISQEKELLVGSEDSFYLVDSETLKTIKRIETKGMVTDSNGSMVTGFNLIEQETKVLFAMDQGQLYKYDIKNRTVTDFYKSDEEIWSCLTI